MDLVQIPVLFRLKKADNSPAAGVKVRSVLTRAESDGAYIVPSYLEGYTDSQGELVMPHWPNSRGTNSSQYTVSFQGEGINDRATMTVTEAPSNTWPVDFRTLVNQAPYPDVPAGQLLLQETQAARDLAVGAKTDADQAATNTATWRDLARDWASKAGGAVADGLLSAYAYAMQAMGYRNAAQASASTVATIAAQFGDVSTAVGQAQSYASAASGSAGAAATSATNAATSETNAAASASAAATAKTGAEGAQAAAIIQAGVYVDEPTGRAAVADGVAFKVAGSGDVAAYEYRRVNSGSSTLIATYPHYRVMYAPGLRNSLPNLFAEASIDISSLPDRYIDGGVAQATVTASAVGGLPCWRAQVGTNTTASLAWRFPLALFAGASTFSCSLRFPSIEASNGGSGNRSVRVLVDQRDSGGASIAGTLVTTVIKDQTAGTEIPFVLEGQSINGACASVQVRVEIQNTNGTATRSAYVRDMLMAAGPVATFRRPLDARATSAEAIAGTDTTKIVPPSALAAAIAAALVGPNAAIAAGAATIDALIESLTSERIAPPAGLLWPSRYPLYVYRTAGAVYKALVNQAYIRSFVDARVWSATPYYVDAARPDNSGNGLSWATAKRDINAAITTANADLQSASLVYIKGGDYHQTRSFNGSSGLTGAEPSKPCAFVPSGGRVRHYAGTTETFPSTTNATYTNTFVGGPSSAVRVFDRINLTNGKYTELTQAADAAAVNATPGTWCVSTATGSQLTHIRRADGAQPTLANTLILRNIHVAAFDNCVTDLYFEGIDFEGGPFGALWCDPPATRNVVVNNCTFRYAGTSANPLDGLRVRRTAGLVLAYNCDASCNWKDGFNYHEDSGPGRMYVLQIGCTGDDNGRAGSSSNNGFTTHDGVIAIEVNGVYAPTNDGANFHVIEDTLTWAVGTQVTTDAGGDTQRAAFKASNNAQLWVEGTRATTPASGDYALYAQGLAGRIFKRNHTTVVGSEVADTGGAISTF